MQASVFRIITLFCLTLSFTGTEISGGSQKVNDRNSASWVVHVGSMVDKEGGKKEFLHLCVGTVIDIRWVLTSSFCNGVGLVVLGYTLKFNQSDSGDKYIYNVIQNVQDDDDEYSTMNPGGVHELRLLNVDRDMDGLTAMSIPSSSTSGNMTVYGWNGNAELMEENVTVISTNECFKMENRTNSLQNRNRAASLLCVNYEEKSLCNVEKGSGIVSGEYLYGIALLGPTEGHEECETAPGDPTANLTRNFKEFQGVHTGYLWIMTVISAGTSVGGAEKLLLLFELSAIVFLHQ